MGWWNKGGKDVDFDKDIDIDIDLDVDIDYDIDLHKDVDIDFDLSSDLHIDGNTTSFTVEAEAVGDDTFVEVDVVALSTDGLSSLTMVGTIAVDG